MDVKTSEDCQHERRIMDAKGKVIDWENLIVECLDCGLIATWPEFETTKPVRINLSRPYPPHRYDPKAPSKDSQQEEPVHKPIERAVLRILSGWNLDTIQDAEVIALQTELGGWVRLVRRLTKKLAKAEAEAEASKPVSTLSSTSVDYLEMIGVVVPKSSLPSGHVRLCDLKDYATAYLVLDDGDTYSGLEGSVLFASKEAEASLLEGTCLENVVGETHSIPIVDLLDAYNTVHGTQY